MSPGGTTVLDRLARLGVALAMGLGGSSLILSMVGLFSPWLAWPIGLGAAYAIVKVAGDEYETSSRSVACAVLTVAIGITAFGIASPHEHVLGGRDAATYVATASWISREGSVLIDAHREQFDGLRDVDFESLGFRMREEGRVIYPQFMHLFPATMALFGSTAGPAAMLWVAPILGGIGVLALFSVARRLVPPWWAVLVVVCTVVGLPYLYFTRAPFSEPFAFVFGMAGISMGIRAVGTNSRRMAALSGACFGGVFVSRLDGILVLLGLAVYVGSLELLGRTEELPVAKRIWAVSSLVSLLGVVDSFVFSPFYVADHGQLLVLSLVAILLVRLVVPILARSKTIDWGGRSASRVVVALLAVWLVAASLRDTGFEPTGAWLSWYLGLPLLICGLLGALWSLRLFLTGASREVGLPVSLVMVTAAVYMFRPSIAPDHIWAMRRFLPLVIPLAVLFGVWLIVEVLRPRARYAMVVVPIALAVFVLPGSLVVWQAGPGVEIEGGFAEMGRACDRLGPDAVVLVDDRLIADVLMPMTRGWCGLPVAFVADSDLEPGSLASWASALRSQGRQAVRLGLEFEEEFVVFEGQFQYLENAIGRPPRAWEPIPVRIVGQIVG